MTCDFFVFVYAKAKRATVKSQKLPKSDSEESKKSPRRPKECVWLGGKIEKRKGKDLLNASSGQQQQQETKSVALYLPNLSPATPSPREGIAVFLEGVVKLRRRTCLISEPFNFASGRREEQTMRSIF